jgi:hypothetical protein
MLSALPVNDPNAGGPAALSGVYANASLTTGSPTSSMATEAPVPGAPEQFEQTVLSLSSLEGGGQGPATAYQRLVVELNVPNQPLASQGPIIELPTFQIIPTVPVITARPFRLGGSGGDSRLNRPNVDDSIFQQNIEDEFWSNFDQSGVQSPTSEIPGRELMERLSRLGEFDNLIDGDSIDTDGLPPASAVPQEPGASATPDEELHDRSFDLHGSNDDDLWNDTPALHGGATGHSDEDSPQSVQIAQAEVRLPASSDWSDRARAAIGVAMATLWATSDEDAEREGHVARFKRLHRN